jgi:Lipid A 3-O-deacylase (PagL)/OmpA-like transmembrane domain
VKPKKEMPARIPFILLFLLTTPAMTLAGSVGLAMAKTPPATAKHQASTGSESAPVAPSITSQPSSQTVNPGQTATFAVVATGTAILTYQWRLNSAVIIGANSSLYTTPAATVADNGALFSVTVSNSAGSINSTNVTLTVNSVLPPGQSPAPASVKEKPPLSSRFLLNSYVGLQIGYVDYPFSNSQVEPGFQAQSVQVPHLAVRVVLYGHEFNKYFSVQISEMRPVEWVEYRNLNGDQGSHSVWMNIGGLTAKARLPLTRKISVFGEGGLGIVTRKGFTINQSQVVSDASYSTLLFGGGLEYRLNDSWSLLTEVTAALGSASDKQPRTVFLSGGFNYTMRRIPSKVVGADSSNGPIWPKNILQVGYITDALGFGVNNFVSKGKVPIFWPGNVEVADGFSVNYQRNVLHTRRFFAIDWGASVSTWRSRIRGERFYTASLYPVLRFPLVRTNPLEFYFSYSLVGPALITRTNIDDQEIGRKFTFQDYMSVGFFLGRKRMVTAEVRIAHYSNGNLFPQNPGVTIPLGFYLGSTF